MIAQVGGGGIEIYYLFEKFLDLRFRFCFFFCGVCGDVGSGGEAGVGVEEGVCLLVLSRGTLALAKGGWLPVPLGIVSAV